MSVSKEEKTPASGKPPKGKEQGQDGLMQNTCENSLDTLLTALDTSTKDNGKKRKR